MPDADKVRQLARLFGEAARAHHEATGGPNPGWARWYAEYLVGRIDTLTGSSFNLDGLEEWLIRADRKQRAEAPEARWPYFYAELLLAELEED